MYIDARRSGARPEAEAPDRRALLRAGRLSGHRSRGSAEDGDDRQGPRRSDPHAAGRRPGEARRRGLCLRARPALRSLPADRLPSPQGPPRGRHRRLRAAWAVGLLLRQPRLTRGAEHMAEQLTDPNEIREAVRERYARAALDAASTAGPGCCTTAEAECGCGPSPSALGCGNPTAVADLNDGEVVLELGSGGGEDVFISAARVGPAGRVYGVDMTDEMLELARRNQQEAGIGNVEFLKGTIEQVPLPDDAVDVVISNCVINLSADKPAVFREAARVLRPGGRLAVTDIVADPGMDEETRRDMAKWAGCLAGALTEDEFRQGLEDAGFVETEIHETHRVNDQAA